MLGTVAHLGSNRGLTSTNTFGYVQVLNEPEDPNQTNVSPAEAVNPYKNYEFWYGDDFDLASPAIQSTYDWNWEARWGGERTDAYKAYWDGNPGESKTAYSGYWLQDFIDEYIAESWDDGGRTAQYENILPTFDIMAGHCFHTNTGKPGETVPGTIIQSCDEMADYLSEIADEYGFGTDIILSEIAWNPYMIEEEDQLTNSEIAEETWKALSVVESHPNVKYWGYWSLRYYFSWYGHEASYPAESRTVNEVGEAIRDTGDIHRYPIPVIQHDG
jgi:hypothetical protein